jgi:hypothetical protein
MVRLAGQSIHPATRRMKMMKAGLVKTGPGTLKNPMTRGSSGMATSFYKVPYQHQEKESPCRFSTFAGNYNHKISKSPRE